jgi:2-polyprenyl-6-methoxyphenol hydroxylase-like FAD-dependent oxidoreductase
MRVVIAGAGLSGLMAGALLARQGHSVTIADKAQILRPLGAGLLLQPPGMAVLHRLGVLDGLTEKGRRITSLFATTTRGRPLLDVRYSTLKPGLFGLGLARADLWQSLIDSCHSNGVSFVTGQAVTQVHDHAEQPALELADGSRLSGDLVIDASGCHSRLRDCWSAAQDRLYPWGCLWTSLVLPDRWPDDVLLQRCHGTRSMLGILPIQPGRAAFYWSVRNDRVASVKEAGIDAWRRAIQRQWPELGPLVEFVGWDDLEHASYRDVWVRKPYGQRCVVIGDACHGTSPQLGQGTTQGFRDAATLVDCLEAVGGDPAVALPEWWRIRRSALSYYRDASRLLTPLFQSDWSGLAVLRDLFAIPASHLPGVGRLAVESLAGTRTGFFSSEKLPPPFCD